MELDLVALLVGASIGAVAGFVAGVYTMFKKVLSPVNDLIVAADKLFNKVASGGGKSGGGIGALINSFLSNPAMLGSLLGGGGSPPKG